MEKQDASMGLPRGIEAIGFDGQVWLKTQGGYFMADDDLIEWTQAMPFASIPWSQTLDTQAAQAESDTISLLARSSHLTWERVILDIHSGRFFGSLGPWFMDLVALSLIIMAISGIYLWVQGRPKKKDRVPRYQFLGLFRPSPDRIMPKMWKTFSALFYAYNRMLTCRFTKLVFRAYI